MHIPKHCLTFSFTTLTSICLKVCLIWSKVILCLTFRPVSNDLWDPSLVKNKKMFIRLSKGSKAKQITTHYKMENRCIVYCLLSIFFSYYMPCKMWNISNGKELFSTRLTLRERSPAALTASSRCSCAS